MKRISLTKAPAQALKQAPWTFEPPALCVSTLASLVPAGIPGSRHTCDTPQRRHGVSLHASPWPRSAAPAWLRVSSSVHTANDGQHDGGRKATDNEPHRG